MSTFRDDAQQPAESTNLTGHAVLDDHHNKVGTVATSSTTIGASPAGPSSTPA